MEISPLDRERIDDCTLKLEEEFSLFLIKIVRILARLITNDANES